MRHDAFERLVGDALAELPAWALPYLENVVVLVEDEDPEEPDLLGLYEPMPFADERVGAPARIVLYRLPLEDEADGDPARLRQEVRITVLHEIGHHFGMDEERLDELGYG